ncbi:MAG: hypothetical protein KC621_00785 [Myxococcales bacterium]|nr:hypothetical protein [Myxococcales bacterium]
MCDTLYTRRDRVGWFGKNSDREPDEAQAIEVVPPRTGLGGALRCTHVEVPQTASTRGLLLSRPAWMWGAEMGANDAGVVIGNEAVFTRMPVEERGLTGMDLLRLALERSGSAEEAVEVMIGLLAAHPQGGRMGFRDQGFRYHSSFLAADADGAFVLETAGPYWAVERVASTRTLSNVLSIGVPDRVHPEAADHARRKGWLKRGEELHFARAFSDPFLRWATAGEHRRACTTASATRVSDAAGMRAALTDHQGRHPADGLRIVMPCAHATWLPTRAAGQTTGSWISALGEQTRHYATGTSSPCLSVHKPLSFDTDPGPLAGEHPDNGLWWRHERLHRAVLQGWEARAPALAEDLARLQSRSWEGDDTVWPEHCASLPAWRARAETAPAGGAPLFRWWWRRRTVV